MNLQRCTGEIALQEPEKFVPSSLSLDVLKKGFLEDLRFEGTKKNTIDKHERNLVIMARQGMVNLQDVTKEKAKHFLMQKRVEGRSVSTIRNYLKTLRRFGKWLERESFVKDSPFRDVPYPRQERKPPVIPSESDFQEIRRVIPSLSRNAWANQRFLNFIDFLACTGARITSGRCVRLGDIDTERGIIKLEDPKNNSYYFFPIDERLK